jgi:hypothetical protein
LVEADELPKVGVLQRVGLQREVPVRPQVVDPELLRPRFGAGRTRLEEEDVRPDSLGVEDASGFG